MVNAQGEVVAVGRNQIGCAGDGINPLAAHQLAHAEANAILQLSEEGMPNLHPDIRQYTLYAVMEPCPFCFGAVVMGSIRNVKFAARDGHGGATSLNDASAYIRSKKIKVEGPFPDLERWEIAMLSCFELEHRASKYLLDVWRKDCPSGVSLGERMHKDRILYEYALSEEPFAAVLDYMMEHSAP